MVELLEESSLSSALQSSLSAPPLILSCTQCPKTFETTNKLQQHQQMFHTDKSFVCEICGKAFRFRSNLAEHRSVHTALKPYVCKFCGKSSRLKGNLTKHILKHHKREQAEQVSKDDIIVRKEPSATDLLEKSMLVLQQHSSPINGSNGLSDFVSLLPKEEKSDPDYERAIFLSFGLDQGSMDLTGGSPDGSSENGTEPTGGSHDFDSEISGSPLPTSTIGGASSLQALLAQVASSTPSTPPPSSMTPSLSSSLSSALPTPSNGLNTPLKTQCTECGKHFRKVSALQLHMTLNHGCAPPASSISSSDEKMIIDEPESSPLTTTTSNEVMRLHNDLRHVQNFMTERFVGLEQTMRGFDERMRKMEKNVETVMNSMYSLVQLQTGLSTSVTRIRDEMRTFAVPAIPDVKTEYTN
ncbi:hypothetical protein PMAYCL1PPCAC_02877 [Pristionchus mayeri]|uniref:C2H2-type domain-containing protein n=1 Tax=Pristionchus mayeri TaxID=1317129 RepID=A0AAN4Z7C5_9BILA|nr:hypothetical protein PMAYCL1PPCAC_02877 [Pristionchus mayeri]